MGFIASLFGHNSEETPQHTFFSIGEESNGLIKALGTLYSVNTSRPFTRQVTAKPIIEVLTK